MRKQDASRATVAGGVVLVGAALPASAMAAGEGPGGTTIVAAFLGGLLASLTPCVYPVIPLAVSVIGSWGEVGRRRAAFLSAMYAAGMTTTYAALGVVAGLTGVFFGSWSASPSIQFFFALLIMTSRELQTLPVGIALFPGLYTMPWGEISAAATLATLPLVFLVLIFQRRIITGLTAGGVKG